MRQRATSSSGANFVSTSSAEICRIQVLPLIMLDLFLHLLDLFQLLLLGGNCGRANSQASGMHSWSKGCEGRYGSMAWPPCRSGRLQQSHGG